MSSTMTVMPSKKGHKGLFGGRQSVPVWLQFVPGVVMDVVINNESPAYKNDRDINSILAKSHVVSNKGIKLKNVTKKRYYPLLRGITDTPIKGDQVLLCTFGGINYYLGPVNTVNSPNWNVDHMNLGKSSELGGIAKSVAGALGLNKYGVSSTFPSSNQIKRLQKDFKTPLDDSLDRYKRKKLIETHGDMVFEGRHGNSLRIGSRDMNPYIIISNGRSLGNDTESNLDGTIVMISDDGTIHEHFPGDIEFVEEGEPEQTMFVLSSDTVGKDKEEGQKRMIGSKDPESEESTGLYNYLWNEPHFFLNSDKITINSKKESIFLSSIQDVVIGAGKTLEFVSENETVIESSNIYLGRQARIKKAEGGEEPAEPLVLGEQLRLFLEELIGILETQHGLCQGAPIPIMDSTGAPLVPKWQQLKNKISKVDTAPFNSQYHFIEDNGNKPE